jgi:hypothetical protein
LECQIDFIADTIAKMEEEGLCSVEPTQQAEDKWKERISSMSRKTLFVENDSWWTGANIPGKKKEMLVYIGGIPAYEQECREALDGWKGLEVKRGEHPTNSSKETQTPEKPGDSSQEGGHSETTNRLRS